MVREVLRGYSNRIMETQTLFLLQITDRRVVLLEITRARPVVMAMVINLNIDKNSQSIKVNTQQLINSTNSKAHRRTLTLLNLQVTKILIPKM